MSENENGSAPNVPSASEYSMDMSIEKLAILLDAETAKPTISKEKAQDESGEEPEDADPPESDEPEAEGTEEAEPDDEAEQESVELSDEAEIDLGDGTRTTLADLKAAKKQVIEFQRDYSRKTQAIADDRKVVEEKAQTILERAQQLQQERETFLALAQEFLPPVPQRPTVSPSEDPMAWVEFSAAKEQYEAKVQRLNEVARQRQEYAEQQKQQQSAELPKIVAQEREKLLARYPSLKDAKVAEKTKAEMASIISEKYGFHPDEIANVADHRAVAMMLDLLDYQRIKAAAPAAKAKLESKPPLVKPAKRVSPQAKAQSERQDLHARLGKTGRRDDAVAILKALDL